MPERVCVLCGCSASRACPGGCSWTIKDHHNDTIGLCSVCADAPSPADQRRTIATLQHRSGRATSSERDTRQARNALREREEAYRIEQKVDSMIRRRRAVRLNGTISEQIDREDDFPEGAPMPHLDLRDGKKVSYTPNPTDRDGNATSIQAGSLVLVSSNEEVVAVSSDGNTGVISSTPGGGTGFVAVTATADADLGEGVRTITESWSVSIIPGDAAALGGTIGPEEDSVDEQPAETPTPVTE